MSYKGNRLYPSTPIVSRETTTPVDLGEYHLPEKVHSVLFLFPSEQRNSRPSCTSLFMCCIILQRTGKIQKYSIRTDLQLGRRKEATVSCPSTREREAALDKSSQ